MIEIYRLNYYRVFVNFCINKSTKTKANVRPNLLLVKVLCKITSCCCASRLQLFKFCPAPCSGVEWGWRFSDK